LCSKFKAIAKNRAANNNLKRRPCLTGLLLSDRGE
jgi:hypothetical protein